MSRRKPKLVELDFDDFKATVDRSKTALLSDEDREALLVVGETLLWVVNELEKKDASLARFRESFSINTKKTEKTREVLKPPSDGSDEKSGEKPRKDKKSGKKPKGHGRNGADAYKGAKRIDVPH